MTEADLRFLVDVSSIGAFVVALVGAAVGVWGYWRYRHEWGKKRKALEKYLKRQKETAPPGKKGQHTTNHIIRHVGLTEDEILKISFESDLIGRVIDTKDDGKAGDLFFEYLGK